MVFLTPTLENKYLALELIDELLQEYKNNSYADESFSEFIESTTDNEIPVWKSLEELRKWLATTTMYIKAVMMN